MDAYEEISKILGDVKTMDKIKNKKKILKKIRNMLDFLSKAKLSKRNEKLCVLEIERAIENSK